MLWTVIGILLGIAIGIGLALRITVQNIKGSNDVGDSKGDLEDFHAVLNIIVTNDGLTDFNRDRSERVLLEDNFRSLQGTGSSGPSE